MSLQRKHIAHASALALGASLALAACKAGPPEPTPDKPATQGTDAPKAQPKPPTAETSKIPTYFHHPIGGGRLKRPLATVRPSPDDPLKGEFTLDDATKGLPPGKDLVATFETSQGKIECKLLADKAPISVANFVGLARGVRPWKTPDGKWEKKPAYDGTLFHRVVKGFMIQGGDPKGNGSGEPGYVIPDELWEGGKHDKAGLLCMANRGPNTNGAQFFITDAAAPHLDSGYTIFGECGPEEVIHKIASLPVRGERPETPPEIKKVTISRK